MHLGAGPAEQGERILRVRGDNDVDAARQAGRGRAQDAHVFVCKNTHAFVSKEYTCFGQQRIRMLWSAKNRCTCFCLQGIDAHVFESKMFYWGHESRTTIRRLNKEDSLNARLTQLFYFAHVFCLQGIDAHVSIRKNAHAFASVLCPT